MSGPPGAGKTMLARRLPSIMPVLTRADRDASSESLRDGPGITAVREDSTGEVILTVASAESDRTLRNALDRGWSVRSVRPSYSGDDPKLT